MALSQIFASTGVAPNRAITRAGGGEVSKVDRYFGAIDATGLHVLTEPNRRSWVATGIIVTSGNSKVLFDNIRDGGSLESVMLVNRGPNEVYIGFGSGAPGTGGFPLESGESVQYSDMYFTRIWAYSHVAATTGTIEGQGFYTYNRNTI